MTRADLRLELRAKNAPLWHLIFDGGDTVASFCRAHGLSQQTVGELLNLKRLPYRRRSGRPGDTARQTSEPTDLAVRLAAIAGRLVEDLFPPDLYALDFSPLVAEVPTNAIKGLSAARRLALPPSQEDEVSRQELTQAFGIALQTLTPRQERIIRLRYGFDGGDGMTLAEVAKEFSVSPDRIRQIEAVALRKLRHPARLDRLRRVNPPKEHRWRREHPSDTPSDTPLPDVPDVVAIHAEMLERLHQLQREAAREEARTLEPPYTVIEADQPE